MVSTKRTPVHAIPLIERIRRLDEAAGIAAPAPRAAPTANQTLPKYIPVKVWAEQMFGEFAPHRHTLSKWIRTGRIRPMPVKVGRTYFCRRDAEYIGL